MHASYLTLPLVLSALTAQTQIVLEVEPNNTPTQAQAISPGQQIRASFSATADEEWFSFTLTAPGQVHLRSLNSGTLSLSTNRNTRIALFDATGTTRLAWNDDSSSFRADCGVTVPAGSYLWRVGYKIGPAPAAYDLDFFVLPGRPIDTNEAAEPNDPRLPGGQPTPMSLGDTVEGTLTSGDSDFWSFTLGNPGAVRISTFDDGGIPQLDFVGLRFWRETSPGSWVGLGTTFSDVFSHRVNLFSNGVLQPGTYAVAVDSLNFGTVGPWTQAGTGRYSLRTELIGVTPPVYVASTTQAEPTSTNACIGSNGQRPQIGNLPGETPVFHSTFETRLERAIPSTFAIYVLGFSSISPLTLGFGLDDSLGNPTPCGLRVSPDVLFAGVVDSAGNSQLSLTFPFVQGDIGLRIFQQAICFDPTLNAFGFSTSNDSSYVLGDRPF